MTAKLSYNTVVNSSGVTISCPTGSIAFFAGSAAPSGYVKCNGAALSRSTYYALFNQVGTTFGSGDGSTTFNVPDYRGYFMRGLDDGRGIDVNRAINNSQADSIQSHNHSWIEWRGNDWNTVLSYSSDAYNPGTNYTETTSPAAGSETRPKNIALLACIKI